MGATGNHFVEHDASLLRGQYLRLMGRPEAEDAFRHAVALSEGHHVAAELFGRAALARLYGETGRAQEVAPHLARCREIMANGEDWRGVAGHVAWVEGVAAAAEGRMAEAEPRFERAVAVFQQYRRVWDEAEAPHDWGAALAAAGEKQRALAKFDAALDIYRRIGAGERWIERVLTAKMRAQDILKA